MSLGKHPHVVVIGFVWPEPDSSAAGHNMLGLIANLRAQHWQVTFMTAASDSVHKTDLQTLGVASESIALNCSSFDARIAELQPDIVVFDRFMTEEQFSWRVRAACPDALRVLNTEDLHGLRHARHEAIKKGLDADIANLNNDMLQREVAAILRCDLSLIISTAELDLLTQRFGVPPQQLMLSPLALPDINTVRRAFSERTGFISIGNFRHAPNWDAVLQLKQLWPHIRKQCPNATLSVCGAYPPKKATDLHDPTKGFLVKGWVDDAHEALNDARVLLAPLRFGAGVKGKLLCAMQVGTPSVTTPIGAEGIAQADSWPGAVCRDNSDFIAQAIRLYEDEAHWQQAQALGDSIVHKNYSQSALANQQITTFSTLLEQRQAHRDGLFLQGLLWHNSLRATQYMSQWIEAKNRP